MMTTDRPATAATADDVLEHVRATLPTVSAGTGQTGERTPVLGMY